MIQASSLLTEVRRRGAQAYRVGDRVRLRPAAAIPAELLDELRHHKADLLRLLPDVAQNPPSGPWCVVVESCTPRRGTVQLDTCTVVIDTTKCIERDLIDLERAVAHKNAGRDTAFTRLIDEYVERLRACGVVARVEAVT